MPHQFHSYFNTYALMGVSKHRIEKLESELFQYIRPQGRINDDVYSLATQLFQYIRPQGRIITSREILKLPI